MNFGQIRDPGFKAESFRSYTTIVSLLLLDMWFISSPIHRWLRDSTAKLAPIYQYILRIFLYLASILFVIYLIYFFTTRSINMRMFEASLDMDDFRLELSSYWTNYRMMRPKPGTCDNTTLFVAIMTTSNIKSYRQRMAIRKYTLDRVKGHGVVAKFFLGHQPGFRYDLVKEEIEKYDDMVYFDSDDNYRNNFVKWYAMYQYHQRYCPHAKYFIKIDDDTAVDWKRVIKWTERNFDGVVEGKSDYLVCQRFIGMRPVRNKEHIKWYISPKEYSHRFWPTYCYGYVVLMPNSTVAKLSEASKGMPLIHMDDVLYTGLAARAAKVPVYDFEGFREGIHPRYPCTEDGVPYPTAIHLQKTPKAMARTMDKLTSLDCENDDVFAP